MLAVIQKSKVLLMELVVLKMMVQDLCKEINNVDSNFMLKLFQIQSDKEDDKYV